MRGNDLIPRIMAKVEEENKSGNLWDLPAYIPDGAPGEHKSLDRSTALRKRMKSPAGVQQGGYSTVARSRENLLPPSRTSQPPDTT
jgi:hypothetical protein